MIKGDNMKGPFFVKENGEMKLAGFCKECAFGDETGCVFDDCCVVSNFGKFDEEKEDT